MNKKKEIGSRSLHRQLALKLTIQWMGLAAVFVITVVLLGLLFLIIMGTTNLDRTAWFQGFKPFFIPTLGLVAMLGCGYLSYRFLLRPLEYLEDVAEAAKQLAHPTEVPIMLPDNLNSIEQDLNLVRTQALDRIRTAQKAEQQKEDLLVYLAHDLKTPLTSVIGYLKLIEDEPEITPELIQKYSGIARGKAERVELLINEFFEMTRYRIHEFSLEPVKTNLSRMLMQITYEFHPILAEKGLQWKLEIPEQMEVVCDTDKLERAIDNLIQNAIYYSDANTELFLSLIQMEDVVRICIRNRGQTIPQEKLERIFEQFYRLDYARSTHTGGAGLGLAIAREIVTLHGGTITAHSSEGTTEFVMRLPMDCQKIVRNTEETSHK